LFQLCLQVQKICPLLMNLHHKLEVYQQLLLKWSAFYFMMIYLQ
ncbi:hypothetical protein T01_11550, partial [Trichinella spiralis]